MYCTKDWYLDAIRISVPLMLLKVIDDIPMTREPSDTKVGPSSWRRRNKLSTLGGLNTANRTGGREQTPSLTQMTAASR